MSPKKRKTTRRTPMRAVPDFCAVCKSDEVLGYKNYQFLAKFLSDRAKILGKKRSGVCSRHQKQLTIEIKRARFLGLLPFTPSM